MEQIDFKEISKKHYQMMNSELYPDPTEKDYLYTNQNYSQSSVNERSSDLNVPYYFDFSNSENKNYTDFKINYLIQGTNTIIQTTLKIRNDLVKHYGEFYNEWKEIISKDNNENIIYWYNNTNNKSTWDSPYFIFICLLDNKVNPTWVPSYWAGLENNNDNYDNYDNYIQIQFTNKKDLFINRTDKLISNSYMKTNPLELQNEPEENISSQDYLKEIMHERIKKTFEKEKEEPVTNINVSVNVPDKEIKIEEAFAKEISDFKLLLKEKTIGPSSVYDKELHKLIYDIRYSKLPQEMRKNVFEEYVKYLNTNIIQNAIMNEKVNLAKNKKLGQENFKTLLKKAIEEGNLNVTTPYRDFIEKYENDSLFQQATDINKEFLFNEAKLKLKKILEERKNLALDKFKAMLNDNITFTMIDSETSCKDIKRIIKNHPDYKQIGSSSERKNVIKDYLEEMKKLKSHTDKLYLDLNEPEKKKKLVLEFAQEEFMSLLKDKIKIEISWEEAQRKLNTELRWKNINLTDQQKIDMFKDFIFNMRENRKKAYRKLLEEKIGLNQEITWHEAQHMLQIDERFREVLPKDRELLFQEHMAYVQEQITQQFSEFLEQTTLLTHDSSIEGIPFRDLISKLSSDIRCQRMYKYPDKRDKLIKFKIRSLKFKFEKQQREERKNVKYKREEHSNKWEKGQVIK